MKKTVHLVLALIIFLTGCSASTGQEYTTQVPLSYAEIPGVTQEDIDAIEALRAKTTAFTYGFLLSSEAFYAENDTYGGFVSLLYEHISELFGFDFIPQECEWDGLLEKLDSKEIDFNHGFTPSSERLERYYMTTPIFQRSIKIYTNNGNEDIEEISKTRDIRCAFLRDSTLYSVAEASWELSFVPVFVDSEAELAECFESNQIDAFIGENAMASLFDSYDFIDSVEYYPLNYSPISLTTANPELAPIINVIDKYLNNGGLERISELYKQGTTDYLRHKLFSALTEEEKNYIQKHSSEGAAVSVAYETDNYPSCFYNTKEHEFQGAAIDVLNQIACLTGLKFEMGNEPGASWSKLLDGLESGEYSITPELFRTGNRKDRFLWTEEPYYTNNYALLSRADYPNIDVSQVLFNRVGLVKDSAFSDIFSEWFPSSVNVVEYQNNKDAFAALEKGDIDLLMGTQNLLLHITNYQEKPNFKANILFEYSVGSYFGFNNREEVLNSIINKAQRLVDTDGISENWKRKVFDYNSKMLRDMIPYVVLCLALLLWLLLAVLMVLARNRKINKNLEKLVAERTSELELQTATATAIFEAVPDLVFCKDLDCNFTRCNNSFKKHFNCSDDIIGKNDETGIGRSATATAGYRAADLMVMEGRKSITLEETIPSADGTHMLFETIKTPLLQDGKPVGIICISRDITRRKVKEKTLKLTLDNLDTGIYINDIETRKLLFVNEKMATDFNCKDYYGEVCWKVFQEGCAKRCADCSIPKLLESGDKYQVQEVYNPVTNRHYKNTDSIIKWHDGRLVHMTHSVDITEMVNMQEELENASRAKGDFLSRMSHEIRTPLNAVIGMNNIAQSSDDLVKIHQCHEKIKGASKHLLSLINDILDMSKIEADKFELSYNEFDFEKVLMNITNVTNFRAQEKRQELVVNLDKDIPSFILSDELRLSQVITNLLSNAVKFTPENGSVILNVKKTAETSDDTTLLIEVVDSGIGISEEQQKRLFTSFEQADNSISHKFGGTGLGLAISKRIVELMGGTIWIESELNQGAKFAFKITVQKCGEKSGNELSPKIDKNSLRILAVDDSEETLLSIAHVMRAHGLPCDVTGRGAEALEMIEKCGDKSYNIFFVDWQMPGMDGIELAQEIKKTAGDNAALFIISGADWSSVEKKAVKAGVTGFIPKPLFPSSLIDAINGCLDADSAKPEVHTQGSEANLDFKDHTILIAEDIEINQEIMTAVLEESKISIDFANDGQEAVSMFRESPDKYSLILMDIQMPELNGYEATQAIRSLKSERAKSIPIIAMTANVFTEDIENCLSSGMNEHLGKPIDSSDLFDKLKTYLG